MYSVKYGLSKYLKEKCRIDNSTDNDFVTAIKTFKAKITDLQKKGKVSVVHKPQIADYDMKKLMDPANVAFNVNTPCGLQNKVWFDIMYHFCRRGRANLREMKKTTFAVEVDSSGREYIRQIMDKADINHGIDSAPDDTVGEARMYARLCDDMCPAKNFILHPDLDDLWQRPRDSFNTTDDCWFFKSPFWKNLLDIDNYSSVSKIHKPVYKGDIHFRTCYGRIRSLADNQSNRPQIRNIYQMICIQADSGYKERAVGCAKQCISWRRTKDIVPESSAHDLDQIFSAENDFRSKPTHSYIRS
ncbi:hypothetical protein MAR_004021 [Mya arenaria]|uniref:Uncharacterized protein n=1 Tax=Mya arenaria TaxID=6604 RepID=A0ABY7F3J7_MYAAR|nr:hypothetical protein MAR_004021 [Mya arenaria]